MAVLAILVISLLGSQPTFGDIPDGLGSPCPSAPMCECVHGAYKGTRGIVVDCRDRNITTIPTLPMDAVTVDLSVNAIDSLKAFTMPFENLRLLDLSVNSRLRSLNNNTFKGLANLELLDLSNCNITHIEADTFTDLKSLLVLDISSNRQLLFRNLKNLWFGLKHTRIYSLNISRITPSLSSCIHVEKGDFVGFNETSITELYVEDNRVADIDREVYAMAHKVQVISMRRNLLIIRLQRFDPINLDHFKVWIMSEMYSSLFFNKRDIRLQMKRTRSQVGADTTNVGADTTNVGADTTNIGADTTNGVILSVRTPRSLEYLDASNSRLKGTIVGLNFSVPNHLSFIDLSNNVFSSWYGPLYGLHNLTYLDLSNCMCSYMSPNFLQESHQLEVIQFSHNYLGDCLTKDNTGQSFKHQNNTHILDLSNNQIGYLPRNIFHGLKNLRVLKLHSNLLQTVHIDFALTPNLRDVDLQSNEITTLSEYVRNSIEGLGNKQTTISINMAKNNFKCKCSNIEFIKWLKRVSHLFKDFETYMCTFDNGTMFKFQHINDITETLERQCSSYLAIILVSAGVIVTALIIILGGVIYRYRWDLRYLYYSARLKMKGYAPVRGNDDDFDKDVFVSYADEDRGFVRQFIKPKLENEAGLQLLIHDRDFLAGGYVADNIYHAISTCRKTLVVMTKDFLRSKWCVYEMNMARMEAIKSGRNVLCILLKEHVPMRGLPLEIIDIFRQQTYIEYPCNQQDEPSFWERLENALKDN